MKKKWHDAENANRCAKKSEEVHNKTNEFLQKKILELLEPVVTTWVPLAANWFLKSVPNLLVIEKRHLIFFIFQCAKIHTNNAISCREAKSYTGDGHRPSPVPVLLY